jgi:type VI secretion system (T6SS) phospholipase Tle1-like effector
MHPASDAGYDSDEGEQDMNEVWFAGSHADIGGGWSVTDEKKNASHIPLVWMVREAMRAGLSFDPDQLEELGCVECSETSNPFSQLRDDALEVPQIHVDAPSPPTSPAQEAVEKLGQPAHAEKQPSGFQEMLQKAELADIHDSLAFGGGLPHLSVAMWRFMEFMPFRRLDLRPDGTWKPIRWPLPRGETRDIPHNVRIHGSVIRRMQQDKNYRPGNLIVGGGGRGMRRAPEEHGIGEWVCVAGRGDMVDELWERRRKSQTDES